MWGPLQLSAFTLTGSKEPPDSNTTWEFEVVCASYNMRNVYKPPSCLTHTFITVHGGQDHIQCKRLLEICFQANLVMQWYMQCLHICHTMYSCTPTPAQINNGTSQLDYNNMYCHANFSHTMQTTSIAGSAYCRVSLRKGPYVLVESTAPSVRSRHVSCRPGPTLH